MLIQAVNGVHQARQAEDTAFKRFSGKDFASDDLKREDALEDKYMSTALGILNGLLYLPETEPIYRKAQLARQVFRDFNFSTSDGFEAEARKVINMSQQWAAATEYELAELGIEAWVQKAVVQAQKVLQLVTVRVDHESAKVAMMNVVPRIATQEVKNLNMAVIDCDHSSLSAQLTQKLQASEFFNLYATCPNYEKAYDLLQAGKVDFIVTIENEWITGDFLCLYLKKHQGHRNGIASREIIKKLVKKL